MAPVSSVLGVEVMAKRRRSMVAGNEIWHGVQDGLQMWTTHVRLKARGRAPIIVDDPDVGIVERLIVVEALRLSTRRIDKSRQGSV